MSAAAAVQSLRVDLPSGGAQPGFWGVATSTIDWCEGNYEHSFYVAEFWNTVSNLLFVLVGLYGLAQSMKQGFEWRFHLQFIGIMVTGFGSAMFHGTLQHVYVAACGVNGRVLIPG
jgi:dihydroceramidase